MQWLQCAELCCTLSCAQSTGNCTCGQTQCAFRRWCQGLDSPGVICDQKMGSWAVLLVDSLFFCVSLSRGCAEHSTNLMQMIWKLTLGLAVNWDSPHLLREWEENHMVKNPYIGTFYFEGRWETGIKHSAEGSSFHNSRAAKTAQSQCCCQQPARNSPVMRPMTHACPCCFSPSDVEAMFVVWDVSRERHWQSSPVAQALTHCLEWQHAGGTSSTVHPCADR